MAAANTSWAIRSPSALRDVRRLAEVPDPIGPDNSEHLAQIIREADVLVPCWGSRLKIPERRSGRALTATRTSASRSARRSSSAPRTLGRHVGGALVEHLRNGGSSSELKEVSIDAQIEAAPADVPEDERKLSTIDAAARAVHARDFQRKIEMLLKYKAHMSPGAKQIELAGTLREVAGWAKQMAEGLNE